MTCIFYRREFGNTIKLNFRKCSGTSSAPGFDRAMQARHHCQHCDAQRNFRQGTSCRGTLVQFADLQIRPPTMQPEVLSVDPSIDILPE
jgi:hypothetical protein